MRRPSTNEAIALLAGLVHAALVVVVALEYGYDVGPTDYPPQMVLWRYGGLVVLGALPVWLALEGRLVLPLALVVFLAATAFYAELTPPAPVFHDVADLEPSVTEPTGITVVENGLHLVKYASAWYVWTVGAALAGLWESLVRARTDRLPDSTLTTTLPPVRDRALVLAAGAGLVHSLASLAFGWTLGMADDPLGILWALAGGVVVLGVPVYLLVRYDLVWPTAVATLLFVNSVHAQQYGGPGDPHALYAIAWFVFLAVALLPGLLEYGLRRIGRRIDAVPG